MTSSGCIGGVVWPGCRRYFTWKRFGAAATLVLVREAAKQVVRHAPEHRVPLADARLEVLEDLVVRVVERQELRRQRRAAGAERRRAGLVDVGTRVELVVPEGDLVCAVDVVVALEHPRLARRQLRDVVERAGVVTELRRKERAQRAEIRREDARRVAGRRRAARVRRERGQRPRIVLLLVEAEREQPVLDDRAAGPDAGGVGGERARVQCLARR